MLNRLDRSLFKLGFVTSALLTSAVMLFELRAVRPMPEVEANNYPQDVPALVLFEQTAFLDTGVQQLNSAVDPIAT